MSEPWFDPNHWAWLPGTLLGCSVGFWGSLVGVLVPLGKGRTLVFGVGLLLAGLATASLIAGLMALALGQPFGVWFFLVVPGLPIAIILLVALAFLPRLYQIAEAQRMRAGHLD
jgi:hypothetical protein